MRPGAGAVCRGDPAEREAGKTLEVVARQLGSVIDELGVGALSRSRSLRAGLGDRDRVDRPPAQAQEVHAAIRAQLAAENAEVAKVCDSFTAAV